MTSRYPGSLVYVLELAEGVVGFANIGPCRDDDRQCSDQWELYAIYLLAEHWGAGNGSAMLRTALDVVPANVADVSLWVLSSNVRARTFYEHRGFRLDGAVHDQVIGGTAVTAVRYIRPTTPDRLPGV